MSIATISKFTDSILVNGENTIQVQLEWEEAAGYDSEIWCELGSKSLYKYLRSDLKPETVSFTIPVEWLSEIPDSSIGTGKIRVQSMNMSTTEFEYIDIKKFTVYVPEEFKPEISNLTTVMIGTSNSVVDYALYGLTCPEMRAMVTPHPTSPIKKYYITGGDINVSGEFSYSSGYVDHNFYARGSVIKTWSNTSFTLTVEDGRGRKASVTSEEFYVQPYNRPLISSLSAYRTDADGITKADGGHIKVTVNGGMSSIKDSNAAEVNTLKCYLWWRQVNGSYGPPVEITNKEPYIFEANKDYNYEIKCEIRDNFMQTVAYCNVLGNNKDFNIVDGGGGAAIGMKATKGYFDVAHSSRFQKSLSANGVVSSKEGIVSTGRGSKGDFLSFGEATRIYTLWHYVGGNAANGVEVDSWGDFNDLTDLGLYGVYYDEDVSSSNYYQVLNSPCEKAGTLRVYNATGNAEESATEKYLMQEYVVRDGSAIYRRCLSQVRDNSDVEWPSHWTFGKWYRYSGTQI